MLQRDLLRARKHNSASLERAPTPHGTAALFVRNEQPPSASLHDASFLTSLGALSVNQKISPMCKSPSSVELPSGCASHNAARSSSHATPMIVDEKVRVVVRCRPPQASQGECAEDIIVSMDPTKRVVYLRDREKNKTWHVDTPVWSCVGPALDDSPPVSQDLLYDIVGRPLLLHALEGYNSTLMAYGQTGSGKTYTMMGDLDPSAPATESGIIPRVCRDLFVELQNRSRTTPSGESISWEVHVRFVEVYCERVSDLLNGGAAVSIREEVAPHPATFVLLGTRRLRAECQGDLLAALHLGNKFRRAAATKSNSRSSRSHAIFMIELTELLSFKDTDETIAVAPNKKLCIRLVDLAGNERATEAGATRDHLKETRDINLSLFTLGQVVECLTDPKRKQIKPPYRESALTKLLRDAFGGNSKTTMICTISPCERHRAQTLQTLYYATKVRHVRNRPRVAEEPSALELLHAKGELLKLRQELEIAQGSGLRYELIGRQLQEASERFRQQQLEAMVRRETMAKREADLARRLRMLEEQRVAYEEKMAILEAEAERAKAQHSMLEEELRRAHSFAERNSRKRIDELQAQRDQLERAFCAKEAQLLQRQRQVEERLRGLEASSQEHVAELQRKNKELEEELRGKERAASARQRDLLRKRQLAEEAARQMARRAEAMEEECAAQVRSLSAETQRREEEIARMAAATQERLAAIQEEAAQREEVMRRKWRGAEDQIHRIQLESDAREAELSRRVLEMNREAERLESDLSTRLQKAEFELHERTRELQVRGEELGLLKLETARQFESTQARERNLEEHQALLVETLHKREEALRRREEELRVQFEQVMEMQRDCESQRAVKMTALQAAHDDAMTALQARGLELQRRESEWHQKRNDLDAQLQAQELGLKRKEIELMGLRSELDAQALRDRQANLRTREELHHALSRAEAENAQREHRLKGLEEGLQGHRTAMEQSLAQKEAALRKREDALAVREDALALRSLEVDQLAAKLQRDEREQRRGQEEAVALKAKGCASSPSTETDDRADVCEHRAPLLDQLDAARLLLHRREVCHHVVMEGLCRARVDAEEEAELRLVLSRFLLESRELARRTEAAERERLHHASEAKWQQMAGELCASQAVTRDLQSEVSTLRSELTRRQESEMELKAQLSCATIAACSAEDYLRDARIEVAFLKTSSVGEREAMGVEREQLINEREVAVRRSAQLGASAQLVVITLEERHRCQLESHYTQVVTLFSLLQILERKVIQKSCIIAKWQSLYHQRTEQAEPTTGPALQMDTSALQVSAVNQKREEELQRRELGLTVEQGQLQQRILCFEARERSCQDAITRQEEGIKKYLLELMELDCRTTQSLDERELRLVELEVGLRKREAALAAKLHEGQRSQLAHAVEECSQFFQAEEALERESLARMNSLTEEHELCQRVLQGDTASIMELLRRKKEALAAEASLLQKRQNQAAQEEARYKQRVMNEEKQIQEYLLLLEAEDIQRNKLSAKGQAHLQEAEDRLDKAKRREQALHDMARRLQLEALQSQERSMEEESALLRRERSLRKQTKARRSELERRRIEVDMAAQSNERTLNDLEASLRDILNKNRDAEMVIQSKDAQLKRQKRYYADLSKMLEERDRMLQQEHAHRMDGKASAVWLTRDLLSVNENLLLQINGLKRKHMMLLQSDKLECERCNWMNDKDTLVCRCCGNGDLAIA